MIPGIDGTGRARTAPGCISVVSAPLTAPWPSAPRPRLVLPLPDGLDEVTAAAIVNPGMAPGWR